MIISLNKFNRLLFVTEIECVCFELGTEVLNVIAVRFKFETFQNLTVSITQN